MVRTSTTPIISRRIKELFLPYCITSQVPVFYASANAADKMTISYNSVLSSTPFKFLVGPEKKLFTVHSALVTHHSKPLGVLVNGDMSEAKEGCALLEETDEHTFVRFSQYAYAGDYVTADPEILLDSSAIATTHSTPNEALPNPVEGDVKEGIPSISKKDKKGKKKVSSKGALEEVRGYGYESLEPAEPVAVAARSRKSELWDSFKSKAYAISKPAFQARKNREPCEDYTEVFLCHARLYAFADEYDIGPLECLSLHKLHQTLVGFTLYDERVEDIVDLIRYSYSNTAHIPGSTDDMRLLIIHYAACVIEELARNTKFGSLLEEPGSLAKDLVGQMLRRLD